MHTTEFLCALNEWFDATWGSHKSAYRVEETAPDAAILADRTMKRKVANQLTGLAWKRTVKADSYFPSIAAMAVGDPNFVASDLQLVRAHRHWKKALGIQKGMKIAANIVDVCHRNDKVKAKGR